MRLLKVLFIIISVQTYGQNHFSINHSYGVGLNQKYSPIFNAYLNDSIKNSYSHSTIFNFDYNIKLNTKHTFVVSFSVFKRKIRVKEWKTKWTYYYDEYHYHKDTTHPIDFLLIQRESGLGLGYEYLALSENKMEIKFGARLNSYFLSSNASRITLTNSNLPVFNYYSVSFNKPLQYLPLYWLEKKLSFSSNLEINTKLMYAITPTRSLGIRLSMGTSLHSNWDNFSNYVYLGLGAEYSFGKFKEKKILNSVKQ